MTTDKLPEVDSPARRRFVDPSTYAKKYAGQYQHRLASGGIGHNLPQEAPREFAQAIADVDRF